MTISVRNGAIRVQRTKDFRIAINGLLTRRSFLLSEKPDTLAADIAAIDRTLQLLGCTVNPDDYMPTRRNQRVFHKGEMLRLIMGVLKDADKPMTSREICLAILPPDFDLSDKRRVNEATSRVYKALCRECEAGRVNRVEVLPVRWVIYLEGSNLEGTNGSATKGSGSNGLPANGSNPSGSSSEP